VSIRDLEATKRIATIGANAQWFEDNSPILDEHKKDNVVGISAKVITVVMQGGDLIHSSTIGINLPNANWIRKDHGSKSVTLGNIMEAFEVASAAGGLSDEFAYTEEEKARNKEFGALGSLLDVDMHEVIGHASGQINPGIGTPKETLKSYASTLEEARADLVAMYYIMDPRLVELGLMPSLDVGKTVYESQIRNGLQYQLRRVKLGDDIEEAHMRNRQLIAGWAYEMGLEDKVIEKIEKDGKHYYVINDYEPTVSRWTATCTRKCWRGSSPSILRRTRASFSHDWSQSNRTVKSLTSKSSLWKILSTGCWSPKRNTAFCQ
jgi:dipeptidyl-peptidase-3